MNKLQKTISSVVLTGFLVSSLGGAVYAQENAALQSASSEQTAMKTEFRMKNSHNLFSTEFLQNKISGLSDEIQAEILAVAEELNALQPAKPERTDSQKPDSETMTQQKEIMEQIKQIFEANGIDCSASSEKPEHEKPEHEKPELEKPELDNLKAEKPAKPEKTEESEESADGEAKQKQFPGKQHGNKQAGSLTSIFETQMEQLSESDQTAVQALLDELKALQPERTEKPEKTLDTMPETMNENMAAIKELQDELMQLLSDNGITLKPDKAPDKPENSDSTSETEE